MKIYDDNGDRIRSLRGLTEEAVAQLLTQSLATQICPLSKINLEDGQNSLYNHVRDEHGDGPPQGGPRVEPYTFLASDGWVNRFRVRHGIHNVKTYGEKGSSDEAEAERYVAALRTELIERGLAPKRVIEILLNIDETGLAYKSVPKRTYCYISVEYRAKKAIKDRVTVLVGAAMDGFKLKPVVIGKSLGPRPIKGIFLILY